MSHRHHSASWDGLGLPIKLKAPWYWVPLEEMMMGDSAWSLHWLLWSWPLPFWQGWTIFLTVCFLWEPCSAWPSCWQFQLFGHRSSDCLCLELWDRCSWSPLSTAAVVIFVLACCFPQLLNIRANLPLNWVKLSESGEDRHCPLATTPK